MKYGHLYQAPNEAFNSLGNSRQINRSAGASEPSSTGFGVSINKISGTDRELTNDYSVKQKLRNTGMYAKLKNKTIYSADALAHAGLNSGIL